MTAAEFGRSQLAFARLLAEGWQVPPRSFPAALYTLLTFSEHLPIPALRTAVQQQITALEQELRVWEEGATLKTQMGVLPAWGPALFENGRRHLEADLHLLRSLYAQLGAQDPSP